MANSEASFTFSCGCECGNEIKFRAAPVLDGSMCFECPQCGRRVMGRFCEGRKQKASTQRLDNAIIELLTNTDYPIGARSVAYKLLSLGVVEKTERDFDKVGQRLIELRREGRVPYEWIADNSRSIAYVRRHESLADAAKDWQASYRRDMWQNKPYACEVWIEKAGMLPAVESVTYKFGVPVYIAKGFSGISFLHEAAKSIRRRGKPTYIAHLGDHDKAGWDACRAIGRDLHGFGADVEFNRLCVTHEQMHDWQLQTRPPKKRDVGFDECVELDAVPEDLLRNTLTTWLLQYMNNGELLANEMAERAEQNHLKRWAEQLRN